MSCTLLIHFTATFEMLICQSDNNSVRIRGFSSCEFYANQFRIAFGTSNTEHARTPTSIHTFQLTLITCFAEFNSGIHI